MTTRGSILMSLVFLTIAFMVVGQVIVSNKLSTSGTVLDNLSRETAILAEENAVLKTELASASSLTNLSQKAKEKGFIKDSSPLVLVAGQTFALK